MDKRDPRSADYVVIGGGSAGAAVAARLSENPANRVILLEAGSAGRHVLVEMPVGFAKMIGNDKYDWCYAQSPDPSINNRSFTWSAGKMLGGGSSINGQVFIRGTDKDFEHWVELGATGWGAADVAPYFRRMETWRGSSDQARGSHGPQTVSPQQSPHPLTRVFVEACRQAGLPTIDDYNANPVEGAFFSQSSQRDGRRCSTEKGYLREASQRPNLEIVTGATVERLIIENGRCKGAVMVRGGVQQDVLANREVIVSCGSMGSPALLMRSGIGPGPHLTERGIPVLIDRAQVGQNLQEHPGVVIDKYVNKPTLNSQTGPFHMAKHILQYYLFHSGPMASAAIAGMGYARTCDALDEPDVLLGFSPLAYDQPTGAAKQNFSVMPKEPALFISAFICHPKSRGQVTLNQDLQPHIDHRLLGHPDDMATIVRAMKYIEGLFKAPALAAIVTADRVPSPIPANDADWEEFARNKVNPVYHSAGTCRMGSDERAVVDPKLRVRGIDGLRVADASVMPQLTSGNINAPTIMIGEKAAALVME